MHEPFTVLTEMSYSYGPPILHMYSSTSISHSPMAKSLNPFEMKIYFIAQCNMLMDCLLFPSRARWLRKPHTRWYAFWRVVTQMSFVDESINPHEIFCRDGIEAVVHTTCSKVKPQDPARDVDKIAPESILSDWLIILSSWPESGKGAFNIDK